MFVLSIHKILEVFLQSLTVMQLKNQQQHKSFGNQASLIHRMVLWFYFLFFFSHLINVILKLFGKDYETFVVASCTHAGAHDSVGH